MEKPLFSVIIPAYNASKTIERTVDSFLNQTSKCEFEIIVVDDCSKDNMAAVVKAINTPQNACLRYICNERNSGPGVSRDNGIKLAQGDYLVFSDSDDYVDTRLFELLEEKIYNTGADIIYYGCNQVIGDKVFHVPCSVRNTKEEYLALTNGSLCSFCSKRNIWTGIRAPKISNAEDIAIIPILISRANKVEVVEECLYYYIHYPTSLSSRKSPEVVDNFRISFDYTYHYLKDSLYTKELEFHGIKTMLYGATLNAMKAGADKNRIHEIWNEFEEKFPDWSNNQYIPSYKKSKRVFLTLVKHRQLILLKLYNWFHTLLLKVL